MAREAREGARRPRGLREARNGGGTPAPPGTAPSPALRGMWRGPELPGAWSQAGRRAARRAAGRFAGRAAWFCHSASSLPPPAPSCRLPRPGRARGRSPRPPAEGRARGRLQPRVLLLPAGRGAPITASPKPQGCGEGSCWGVGPREPSSSAALRVSGHRRPGWDPAFRFSGCEALVGGGILGAPFPVQPGVGGGDPYLETWRRLESDQSREAGSSGLEQFCSCSFTCLQPWPVLPVASDLRVGSSACRPGFVRDPFCPPRPELGPAFPASQARLKLGETPLGLAARQNARPGPESRESLEIAQPRRPAERWPAAPSSAPPSPLPLSCLFCSAPFNFYRC